MMLDRDLIRQFIKGLVKTLIVVQDILQGGTHEEVLLLEAQRATYVRGAIWI